jgi:hypothetical protein
VVRRDENPRLYHRPPLVQGILLHLDLPHRPPPSRRPEGRPKPSSPSTRPRTSTRPIPNPSGLRLRRVAARCLGGLKGSLPGLRTRVTRVCPLGRAPPAHPRILLARSSSRDDAPRRPTSDPTRPQNDHPSNVLLAVEKPAS